MNGMYVLIPIMIMGVAVTGIISMSILKIQRLRLEETKLRAGDPEDLNELARQVSVLQQEMSEMQERLDFAERMLAQVGQKPALPPPPSAE